MLVILRMRLCVVVSCRWVTWRLVIRFVAVGLVLIVLIVGVLFTRLYVIFCGRLRLSGVVRMKAVMRLMLRLVFGIVRCRRRMLWW